MIKAIILDCFGVLYVPLDGGFYRSKVKNYAQHRAELEDLGRQADYGLINQDELITAVAELTGLEKEFVGDNIVGSMARNLELLDYAQGLRPKYKLGMLSNISMHMMDQFFGAAERKQLFDDVVISSEVGMIKPHPEIYALAAGRLGVDVSEVVMVDDNGGNCEGAVAAGMAAILYKDFVTAKKQLESIIRKAQD